MNIPINAGKQSIRASDGRPPDTKQQAITWSPILDEGNKLSFAGTSYKATHAALFATFGKFPLRLDKDKHSVALTAMSAVAKANGDGDAPYVQLIQALQKYGTIEVGEL